MLLQLLLTLVSIRPAYCLAAAASCLHKDDLFSLSMGLIGLLLLCVAGFLLRATLLPTIKVSEKTWACFALMLYVSVSFFFINPEVTDFSIYLLASVCVYISFISCAFLLYFSWLESKNEASFRVQFLEKLNHAHCFMPYGSTQF
jgi:hypothetical protein